MTAPEEKLPEQAAPLANVEPDDRPVAPPPVSELSPEIHRGLEVGEYDALEQSLEVEVDDEY